MLNINCISDIWWWENGGNVVSELNRGITILDNVTDMGFYNSSDSDSVFENHNEDLTIYCYEDSMAANYALKYDIKYDFKINKDSCEGTINVYLNDEIVGSGKVGSSSPIKRKNIFEIFGSVVHRALG